MTGKPMTGRSVEVQVAATSANLGPGFDTFGLALDWVDSSSATVIEDGFSAVVTGEGAGRLPTGREHLMVAAALRGLSDLGVDVPGLRVIAHNTIPQSRGLGSSSAAIVAGIAMAWGLARADDLDREWALGLAAAIEGHPDNVAAAIYGGFVLAYAERTQAGTATRVARLRVHADIVATVLVPCTTVATRAARRLLPTTVPHAEAAANTGRAALLVHAMADAPSLLLAGTEDRLHQSYRAPSMPESYELVRQLRGRGLAAVISGAGPSVLVLTGSSGESRPDREVPGFSRHDVGIGPGVRLRRVTPGSE